MGKKEETKIWFISECLLVVRLKREMGGHYLSLAVFAAASQKDGELLASELGYSVRYSLAHNLLRSFRMNGDTRVEVTMQIIAGKVPRTWPVAARN